jgi:transcriptional regulator GlxA family with amidase domain
MHNVAVLVYPDCMGTEVFAVADVLLIANHLAAVLDPGKKPAFSIRMVAARREPIALAGGFQINAASGGPLPELLVVPGLEVTGFGQWDEKLALLQPELQLIRRWHARDVAMSAACLGGFLLAEAGVVGARRMTAPWAFEREFRMRYPNIDVESGAVVCQDKGLMTAGAFSSVLDLALHLISKHHGERIARASANMALVRRGRNSQQPYVDLSLLPQGTLSFSALVNRWLASHIGEPYDLQHLASSVHVSPRTLLRRYKGETGITPLVWLQQARIDKAKRLLEVSAMSLGEVVEKVGYQDVATFSRLFMRHVGESPARYRRQHAGLRRAAA